MSEQEYLEFNERLNKGLRESFYKMLELKRKLGQEVVTCDEQGNVIVISAEEAFIRAKNSENARQHRDTSQSKTCGDNPTCSVPPVF